MTQEAVGPKAKKKRPKAGGNWCVLISTDNLLVVGDYRPLAVELLKTVVPGGARRFHRQAETEFLAQYGLSPAQITWLQEARLFNGTWEVLREYRRSLLDVLSLEYPQVWLVEDGQSRHYQLPAEMEQPEAEQYALGPVVTMPLSWARSYALYCHHHRSWESQPCKDVGVIVERPPSSTKVASTPDGEPPKKKKWPDLELHAPLNTLARASRQQVSYYLSAPVEPVRLGRDEAGEKQANRVIDAQRLALLLRAARTLKGPA